jgi:hypothetical protein
MAVCTLCLYVLGTGFKWVSDLGYVLKINRLHVWHGTEVAKLYYEFGLFRILFKMNLPCLR